MTLSIELDRWNQQVQTGCRDKESSITVIFPVDKPEKTK